MVSFPKATAKILVGLENAHLILAKTIIVEKKLSVRQAEET